jgi:D-alanine transaminase
MQNVFLNGEYLPIDQARISVFDRGFTFGDGVYEVFLVYHRKIFRLQEHLERLNNSLTAIYMDNPYSDSQWQELLIKLVMDSPADNQSLYLQITRGVSERDHAIDIAEKPTIFAMSKPLPERDFSSGIKAIVADDIRWQLCYIKATTLLPSVILRHQASLAGAREAILVKDDSVTEGAASNVFIVIDGVVKTSPKDGRILPGITRDLVVELLNESGMVCQETNITRDELYAAEEIWVTSSTWEIVPVVMLDDTRVGDGRPGQYWKQACDIYQQFKEAQRQS